jgi:hypothetical protein
MWLQTPRYSGNGTIRTCSSLVGGGYAIKFAEFDSAGPYSASYRLSQVPQIGIARKGTSHSYTSALSGLALTLSGVNVKKL